MKLYLVSASLVAAAALVAGCAQTHSTEMGAGPTPSSGTLCKDGTMQPPNSACALHGGVESSRGSSPSTPRQSSY
jgi:predicted small secreted protein